MVGVSNKGADWLCAARIPKRQIQQQKLYCPFWVSRLKNGCMPPALKFEACINKAAIEAVSKY
jgi:hypothetical protein